MDIDRPHFRSTSSGSSTAATTSELFICFTSRLSSSSSSSSMKLSKSILSPARAARDGGGPTSLSSSHSRRLRSNGSLKGGQASPFFTTTGKKRGCAFENPEPSSPKVTCIGQVRVKTKKKVKQTRSLSKRRTSTAGEVSFRKIEQPTTDGDEKSQQQQQRYSNASAHYQPQQECQPHRNQRWVHLPISICEALREFSCLLPCKSSCFSTNERDKSEKHNGSNENGCGAVFARWLVSVNDGEGGGKRREIELVVGGGDEEEQEQEQEQEDDEEERGVSMRTSRRHVFEDIEVKDDRIEMKGQSLEREEEAAAAAARVSICIPPKNALLLMRCRSDPMKMAALANRSTSNNQDQPIFEEQNVAAAAPSHDDDGGGKDEIFEQQIAETTEITTQVEDKFEIQGDLEVGQQLEEEELEIISSDEMVDEMIEETELQCHDEESPAVEPVCCGGYEEEEEEESNMSSFEDLLEQENAEEYEDCCPIQDEEQIEEDTTHLSPPTQSDEEGEVPLLLQESAAAMDTIPEDSTVGPIKDPDFFINNDEENQKTAPPPPETTSGDDEEEDEDELPEEGEEHLRVVAKPEENQQKMSEVEKEEEKEKEKEKERERAREREKERPLLPECLLLMMCEPKLSMEVSKETWVCSTDFTRWLPERPRRAAKTAKSGGGGEHETLKRRLSIDLKTKPIIEKSELQQPPRSSCSLPMAAASMASMIEQKLVNAVAYEPFVLTRCKSEPMRTAAVKLMPESCFWKNAVRKMEPHRCATMGVGAAAGVGF